MLPEEVQVEEVAIEVDQGTVGDMELVEEEVEELVEVLEEEVD